MAEYNAGYEIIKSEDIGNSRIVLGRNKYRHYVTWSHNQNGYNHGHYFSDDYLSALADYHQRIINQINWLKEDIQNAKNHIDSDCDGIPDVIDGTFTEQEDMYRYDTISETDYIRLQKSNLPYRVAKSGNDYVIRYDKSYADDIKRFINQPVPTRK